MADDAMAKHMAKIKKMHEREAKAKASKKKPVASKAKPKVSKKKPKLSTKKKKSTVKSAVARRNASFDELMLKLK